jgi:hypothetical protein
MGPFMAKPDLRHKGTRLWTSRRNILPITGLRASTVPLNQSFEN